MPMHDLESLLRDPHIVATDFFPVVDHPTEGRIRNMKAVGAVGRKRRSRPQRLAPRLSEHSAEILQKPASRRMRSPRWCATASPRPRPNT